MAQTIRLTITPDLEKALRVLRHATMGTLNTTELIKMAVGGFARTKAEHTSTYKDDVEAWDRMGAQMFYQWAKEDGTLEVDNISSTAKRKPFVPKSYVPNR